MSNILKNILFSVLIISATSSCLANPTAAIDISTLPPVQTEADLQIFEAVKFNVMDYCGCDGGTFSKAYPLSELNLVDQMLLQTTILEFTMPILFQITNDSAILSPDFALNNPKLLPIFQEIAFNMQADSELIELMSSIEKDPTALDLRAKIAAGSNENECELELEKFVHQMQLKFIPLTDKLVDKYTSAQNFSTIKKICQPALNLLEIKQEFECPSEFCKVLVNKLMLRCMEHCVVFMKPYVDRAELLINADTTDIKAVDTNGRTVLMHHLMGDVVSPKIIKLLIDKGVDLQAISSTGETTLSIARDCDHPTIILEQLTNAGAK